MYIWWADTCKFFYWELYHTICCRQLGMHISGTPHPLTPHQLPVRMSDANSSIWYLLRIFISAFGVYHRSPHRLWWYLSTTSGIELCPDFPQIFMLSVATPDVCIGVCVGNGMLTAVFDKYCLQNISFDFL